MATQHKPHCYLGFRFINKCPNTCKGVCGYKHKPSNPVADAHPNPAGQAFAKNELRDMLQRSADKDERLV